MKKQCRVCNKDIDNARIDAAVCKNLKCKREYKNSRNRLRREILKKEKF